MDTALEQLLTPEQIEALNYSNKLFNWIYDQDFDKVLKLPPEKERADKAIKHIKEWIDNGSFTRSGFMVAFSDDMRTFKKWKI